jgi:hypothetical protein
VSLATGASHDTGTRVANPDGTASVLAGPIVPAMLRLALPTTIVLVVQTLVGVAETYFVSFLGTEALAGVALVFPLDVLVFGTLYLRTVAPVYGAIALGMMLYFASQGAKRVLWPVVAGTVRMLVAALAGWFAVAGTGAGLPILFQLVEVAALLFGGITSRRCSLARGGDVRRGRHGSSGCDAVVAVLDQNRIMTIAMLRPDDWPQATTVCYVNEGPPSTPLRPGQPERGEPGAR